MLLLLYYIIIFINILIIFFFFFFFFLSLSDIAPVSLYYNCSFEVIDLICFVLVYSTLIQHMRRWLDILGMSWLVADHAH